MKILLASDVYPPYVSGVAVYTRDIKDALIKRSHEVKVIIPKYDQASPDTITVPAIKVPIYPSFKAGIPYSRNLLKKIKTFDPDIIHVQTQGTVGLRASAIAKKLRKPLIGTFHTYFLFSESGFEEHGADFLYPIFSNFTQSYYKWFYNRFDGLISPSRSLAKLLRKIGISTPIIQIRNPIDLKKINTIKAEKSAVKAKDNQREKNILYVGRLSEEKGVEDLIRAFKLVRESNPNTKLTLVGDGPSTPKLKELALELELNNTVIFAGFINRETLLKSNLFNITDVFAIASKCETQSLSVIEAMAFGLPIVGVAAMGMPELVTNNGLLSPPGDIQKFAKNLNKILSDEKLRKKLGENSRRNAQGYDINTVIDQLVDYYESFID